MSPNGFPPPGPIPHPPRGQGGSQYDNIVLPPYDPSLLPPGVKIVGSEYAGSSRDGSTKMYLLIDENGRKWDLNHPEDVGYWAKTGKWHDVSKQDGVWQDTWTDEKGIKQTRTQSPDGQWVDSSEKVSPPEVPEYLALRGFGENPPDIGPWTYQDDGRYTARDQYGRQWEWQRDADGNSKIGYKDGDGQWHDIVKQPDGSWWESFKGVDGNTYWGSLHPPTGTVDRSYTDSSGTNHDEQVTPQHTAKPSKSGVEARLAPEDGEPTEGGDQQGQPPIIDPNAQPVPMPSFPGGEEGEEGPPPYGQFPMGKDPNTGQWVPGTIDPDTGEFHPFESGADEGGEGDQPPILDPNAQPMPMPSPDQFTTLEARLVPPDSPALIPGSPEYDPKASPLGPDNVTIDPDLLDPAAPGPTLDPALFDLSAPGPTLDPALLDLNAPGPTLDPALLDPNAPGPTLDAALLDPAAPGPTIDPAQLERGNVEPGSSSGGGAEQPAEVTAQGFTDPILPETAHPEPSTAPGQDLDDPSALG
jgi:hypothetical protein